MNTINEQVFEDNWDELKGKIKSHWRKLTVNDLKNINGSYDKLIKRLEKLYSDKVEGLPEDLHNFFAEIDIEDLQQEAKHKMEEIRGVVKDVLNEYFQNIKEKTLSAEKAVVNYSKENPLKSIGALALIGSAVFCLLKCRRNS